MTETQRHHLLINLLREHDVLSVSEITELLGTSPATTRRDIIRLDKEGKVRKVRNGAEAITPERETWLPLNPNRALNHDEKVRIARAASTFIHPGESVVINCGSTAFLLGQEICNKKVQIITNYLPLANYLIEHDHESVIIMGGQYSKNHSIILPPQESSSSLYAGHWMFTSGGGLTAEGLYKTDMLTAISEQQMLGMVGKLGVLVDSSKLGQRAGMLFSKAENIDLVITGQQADAGIVNALKAQGIEVVLV
ncbi:HTH-type transcriptional regulator UlaR (plasmid) [Pantoea sp. Nvir]|uniref:HTH-type transcriptional regulator UlaR n=1 Tax=Pantoea sp. Nvir TaxID=2576760 RepID=UPI0030CC3FEA